ncbi:zinc dependent phospholipase C family protein [Methylovorus sp. MP688]|uniref:zinc dependent phospholipase C family protein n=1 Tax=Methylovorus sp. (strain MP688) TaxID=887061 RepID=UPI0001EC483C|nr:zinc dependent phospholipase C family protein [Methylovorus sp. MP688]ADQ85030.1 conserved hypothetical protein [Methylovorus sp. MP688]
MKRHANLGKVFWLLPLVLQSQDANAWGLVTHLYFAHSLLWAMPLLDPRLRQAIQRFPELVMAGACLPDLSLVSPTFRETHQWRHAYGLLSRARTDEETAMAIGYASHLYVDVIAHNHFVPAHEAMWMENSMMTHIASEWAMDAHLAPLMAHTPGKLLDCHADALAAFISPSFGCEPQHTEKALRRLGKADRLLRFSRLPGMIYRSMRMLDRRVFKHFVYYIAKTQTAIQDIHIVLQGIQPHWEAELRHLDAAQLNAWRAACRQHLEHLHPAPITYFSKLAGD